MTQSISRRSIFGYVAAAVAIVSVPFRGTLFVDADPWSMLRSALLKACGSRALPLNLGRACLTHLQPYALIREPEELIASFEYATAADVGFADWFKWETISDFDAGRVVRVGGWVISETEFLLFRDFAASA